MTPYQMMHPYCTWSNLDYFIWRHIRDQKDSEKTGRTVRSTLRFTYDEWLGNNNCNGI